MQELGIPWHGCSYRHLEVIKVYYHNCGLVQRVLYQRRSTSARVENNLIAENVTQAARYTGDMHKPRVLNIPL